LLSCTALSALGRVAPNAGRAVSASLELPLSASLIYRRPAPSKRALSSRLQRMRPRPSSSPMFRYSQLYFCCSRCYRLHVCQTGFDRFHV
jgi:hypothetical protein